MIETEEDKGKKPIKITDIDIKETNEIEAKKPIKIEDIEQPKNETSKFNNKKKNNKWLLLIVLAIFIIAVFFFFKTENIEEVKDSVVMIKVYDKDNNEISTGSGFCVYEANYIATNFHVIEGAYKIKIVTDSNQQYSIKDILIFNKDQDLAILSGDFELNPLKIGNADNLKAGEDITAIGSPKGQLNTVSTGIISNADSDYDIRITAPISPGSSGGVLLNKRNKVIGVTYATYDSEDSQNINYAISINYLKNLYEVWKNKEYSTITSSNFSRYIGSLSDFTTLKYLTHNEYSIDSVQTLYKLTNSRAKFEYLLNKEDNSWYTIYNSMSDTNKELAVILFEECSRTYTSKLFNIKAEVGNWDVTEFFLNLKILKNYQYAIITMDMLDYTTKTSKFERVGDYKLEAAQKALILYLMCDYNWSDIHNDNKKDIVEYLDEKFSVEQLGPILEVLGYKVIYKSDGTLNIRW